MSIERVRAVLESPTEEAIQALLDDESTVFWVDCGEEDEAIPNGCEEVLRTGRLSGVYVVTADTLEALTVRGCSCRQASHHNHRIVVSIGLRRYSNQRMRCSICSKAQ